MAHCRILAYAGLAFGLALSSACRAEIKPVTEADSPYDQTAHDQAPKDQAAPRPGSVGAATGLWSVTAPLGKGQCLIALSSLTVGGDFGVAIETCNIKEMGSVSAWRPTQDGFELVVSGNAPALGFRQTGVDSFESRDGALKVTRAAVP